MRGQRSQTARRPVESDFRRLTEARSGPLFQLGQQLLVGLVLFEGGDERFHRLNRIQVHHHAAKLAHGFDLVLGKKFLFLARAAFGDVDGGEKAAVGKLAVEDQLHVASAFELLEDQFVHARTSIDQRRGQDGE